MQCYDSAPSETDDSHTSVRCMPKQQESRIPVLSARQPFHLHQLSRIHPKKYSFDTQPLSNILFQFQKTYYLLKPLSSYHRCKSMSTLHINSIIFVPLICRLIINWSYFIKLYNIICYTAQLIINSYACKDYVHISTQFQKIA